MSISTVDRYLELISNGQRRSIVHRLRDGTAGETTVDDLVEHLYDGKSTPLTDGDPNRNHLSIQLIHNHLPKLADHGLIQYDRETEVVRYQPNERIETVLDAFPAEATQFPSDS